MSNFTFLDGSIVGVYLVACMAAGIMVRKYVGKVEDFLVAGREMNVYLGIASLAATEFGIVTCMYGAQNGYNMGFAGAAPGIITAISMAIVGVTGFCVKPLRMAGVMTVPELFEKKFGGTIRWMSGVVIVLGGLLNMGVFLNIGGKFLITVCGISPKHHELEIMMTLLLVGVAVYTILGGMLSVLVTDYMQFIVMSVGLIVVTILILIKVGWGAMTTAVQQHYGASGFNPFIHPDMGWWYILFNVFESIAAVLTWQTIIQRALAAKDYNVGQKIYKGTSFFFVCRFLLPGLWGIAALATLKPGDLGDNNILAMPKFLSGFMPMGLMGILVAAMLAADMSTDSSYMLSWGSVIYNDILAPFRKKSNLTEKRGLLWNRLIVACIGIFLLIYGLWYPLKQNLWTYLLVTGSIYLSSMSVLLIACCYWKRANNWGAAAAIVTGAIMPITFLVFEQLPQTTDFNKAATEYMTKTIGINLWGCLTYIVTAAAMIAGSLLKPTVKKN